MGSKTSILSLVIFAAVAFFSPFSLAQSPAEISKYFSQFSPQSNVRYDFSEWTTVLANNVSRVGNSNRFKGTKPRPQTGSKLSFHNRQPSWLEGNRVSFQNISDDQLLMLEEYTIALAELAIKTPLRRLTKDQQLAFWLNLYNVTVFNKVAHRYPFTSLKIIRGDGFWDKKQIMVEEFALSLNDIQNHILLEHWANPLVIYGLYQGAIGGPNIRRQAYTAKNVWKNLKYNAEDFVNSIRGTHKKGKNIRVSDFYEWNKKAFPNFNTDLLHHIKSLADEKTKAIFDDRYTILVGYYDYHIADFFNGVTKSRNTTTIKVIYPNGVVTSVGFEIPIHAQLLIQNLRTKFNIYGFPKTSVTVDEVEKPKDNK